MQATAMVHRLLFRNWSGKMGSGAPLTGTNRVRIKFYARMRLHRPKNMRDPDKRECTLDRSKNKQDILKKKKKLEERGLLLLPAELCVGKLIPS